jgi:hypothetical protein
LSDAAVLSVVAVALALVILGLFRLLGVLDSAELSLRRRAAEVRATRKDVDSATELAGTVERDATRGRAALGRLENLKRGRSQP